MKILISKTVHTPIYEQIVNQLRDAVVKGELAAGEGIPSIRALARDLQVSVITTKRAYEELEREGVIESIPGRGFYICTQHNDHLREKQMMNLEKQFSDLILESKRAGMNLDDMIEMIKVLYEEN
ncbi:MAG: GntR family transcriptional regulator [Roseburia sp.]|nr:GntR family transcriptional regulator [Ruminococcus sp.]MCM1155411.1 GntR family transcriptional regulator [Roseburia sp.]MCM1242542.1 GntR family transcriptional regulator [Roseburia sp.]